MDYLEAYIDETQKWMYTNMLKLNEDKTEFIILGTHEQLNKAINIWVYIADKNFQLTNSVCSLGFHLDQQ